MGPIHPRFSAPSFSDPSSSDDGWETCSSESDAASAESDNSTRLPKELRFAADDGANDPTDNFTDDSGLGTEFSTPKLESHMKPAGLRSDCALPSEPAPESLKKLAELGPDSVPLLHIVEPMPGYPRVLTIVLLHANGSNGAQLKRELLESTRCSSGKTLREELPNLRWIFPNAPMQDHIRSDGSVGKCRMWLDPCIYDPEGEATRKMYQSLRYTMESVKYAIAPEVIDIPNEEEEDFSCRAGWEREEIVFGGYGHGSVPAALTWICSEINLAGFVGIRGVLPDNEVRKKNSSKDVIRGKPPGLEFDLEDDYMVASEFYRRWSCSMIRCGTNVIENIASTPVLLTLHENDTHWLVDCVEEATKLYENLIGPSHNMVIRSFEDHLLGAKDSIHVRELDIIREFLNNLVAMKINGERNELGVWRKGATHPSRIRSAV